MNPALASESLLLRKRPAPYVTGGVWVLLVVGFAFLVPYVIYLSLGATEPGRDNLLNILLPPQAHHTAVGSYPMFGGAILIIFGILAAGAEAHWGTWKVRFTQGPSRTQVMLSKFVVAGVAAALIALTALVGAVIASAGIAMIAGRPVSGWAGVPEFVTAALVAIAISITYTFVGMTLAVLFRGTTVAIAVGLVWVLGLENALSGVASIVPALEPVRSVLLSSASGSLVASTGVATQGEQGTPGVVDVLSGPGALLVLAIYAAVAITTSTWLMNRRDIS